MDSNKCPKCGKELNPEDNFCSKCGYSKEDNSEKDKDSDKDNDLEGSSQLATNDIDSSSEEQPPIKPKRNKKLIYSLIALGLVLLVGVGSVFFIKQKEAQELAEKERLAEEMRIAQEKEDYKNNLKELYQFLESGTKLASQRGSEIIEVWGNAAFKISSPKTDQYTRLDGAFVDMEIALQNYSQDLLNSMVTDSILKAMENAQTTMAELKNPSGEYENIYPSALKAFNDCYDFMSFTIKYNETYASFGQKFSDYRTKAEKSLRNLFLNMSDVLSEETIEAS